MQPTTKSPRHRALPLSLLLGAALGGGCSSGFVEIDDETGEASGASASASDSDWGTTGTGDSGWGGETGGASGGTGGSSDGGTDSGWDSDGGGDDSDSDSDSGEAPEPGQLTAGEWRDLDHWDFWLGLLGEDSWKAMETTWNYFTSQRYGVVVVAEGSAVNDAEVTLLAGEQTIWSARTDVRGRADLFAGLFGGEEVQGPLQIAVNGAIQISDAEVYVGDPTPIELDSAATPAPILDLMLMIDTTGSMGDELTYLQAELADVIDEIRTTIGENYKIRLSVNFYRDVGDDYVVRPFPFTEDIDKALADLAAQDAAGGGDYPEAVKESLDNAIAEHEWSETAAARLLFLVLDAPPHKTPAQNISAMNQRVRQAAEKGIRIIPIASSGVNKETEFFLRFIDIATGGTYVFLTSDSGIGGGHIEPTIGEYEVELLNDLLVRVITQAILG